MSRNHCHAVNGPEYVRHFATVRGSTRDSAAGATSDVDNIGDDKDSCFTTKTIDSGNIEKIAGNIGT